MISHESIWRAVDRLADAYGYSPSGLAKRAGLDPTAFNKSKRHGPDGKPRWPSTESLAKILAATGATMADFMSLAADEAGEEEVSTLCRNRMPIIGLAQAGREGYFDEDGYPSGQGWEVIDFPVQGPVADACLYALEVSGDSMQPAYREGDILIVCPVTDVRRGDRVVVKCRNGEVMAKELIRQSAAKVELKSLNPGHEDLTLPAGEVIWMARIIWVSQ